MEHLLARQMALDDRGNSPVLSKVTTFSSIFLQREAPPIWKDNGKVVLHLVFAGRMETYGLYWIPRRQKRESKKKPLAILYLT
mmetsp:Transcript_58991/g.144337  ORF Transcript_58991/g.144337 Transcript_58991/m.144337 type:complete len:83 (-) Transcript_58991:2373-2621(-)